MWVELTPTLLKTHLAQAEIQALESIQVPFSVDEILQDECDNIANAWRSKIKLFHSIDKRNNYVPESLLEFILVHLRYACYTRLPAMGDLLDELRRAEWNRANDVLDNLKKWFIADVDPEEEETENNNTPVIIVNNSSWRFNTI